MKHTWKRLLSVLLAAVMLFALAVPGMAVNRDAAASDAEELRLSPIDPASVDLPYLGELPDEAEGIEQEPYALTDTVRVSIVLDKASTIEAGYGLENIASNSAAMSYRGTLKTEQEAMTARIEAATGKKLQVKWNLTLAANIISANVMYGDIATIEALPGVAKVEIENRYELDQADEPNMATSTVQTGSTAAWAQGYTGAGSKVAVIDTGADIDHQSFSGEGLEHAYEVDGLDTGMLMTAADIAAVASELNSGGGTYYSSKVPYGYNYVDKTADYFTHMQDGQGEHGSHVAGIATANRFVKVDGEWKDALTEVGVQGVAPDAQLMVMKVFGKGGGAYDSDYMSAIEDAIILGADSANLSLGSGQAGLSFSGTYEDIMNMLVENGLVVAMSLGNSYSWYNTPYNTSMYPYLYAGDVNYATGGSPGSFTNSLTVASVDNSGQSGMPILFGGELIFYSQTSGYGNEPIATLADKGELEFVYVDTPGVDDNGHVGVAGDDFLALGSEIVSGKVAICNRGTSSFFAKANAAVAQGAIAVIIVNNQPGVINMNLSGYNYTAPAVSILQEDGQLLKDGSTYVEDAAVPYYTGTISVSGTLQFDLGEDTNVQTMSTFSSWGVPGTLVLKPELTAPGGSIYSVWGANTGADSPTESHTDYELMSGTSMASPQVAGMAAVMGQYIRENGLEEKTGLTARQLTNSLLMGTAVPLVDGDGAYWSMLKQGAGEANVGLATQAKSYILMDEGSTMFPDSAKDGKVKAELGDDPEKTGTYTFGFTINPLGEEKLEYNLSSDMFIHGIAGNAGYGMLMDEATLGLAEGEDFTATYVVDGEVFEPYFSVEADVNKDGETNAADAQAILDYVSGENDGAEYDLVAADVDGDGDVTTADAQIILAAAAATTIVVENEPVHVEVTLQLAEGMKQLIDTYFGQTYVFAYTFIEGISTGEGEIVDVTQSIPMLAFYGNWTDAAMFDHSSVIDEAYGTGALPYLNNANTNYMTVKNEKGANEIYMGNPFIVEDEFPADRLAINGERAIAAFNYMPIRNVGTLGFAIQDEEGKVLWSTVGGSMYAPYYYVNGGAWQNTAARNFSVNKSLSSVGLQAGDKATVGLWALPEYYTVQYAEANGAVATGSSLDAEGFAYVLENGLAGEGAAIGYTVTVDNDAPVVEGAMRDLLTGNVTVKAQDDQYIAYIGVMNKAGTKEFIGIVPEQTEPGEAVEVPLDLEGVQLPATALLVVGDYAGNVAAFTFETGAEQENLGGKMIGFNYYDGATWVELDPATLGSANANSFTGIETFAESNVKVRAAEYVNGYVYMAAEDGYFYAANVRELEEASRVGKYADVSSVIYDMAYYAKGNTLYALGENNMLYTVDQTTGALTPAAHITLNGLSDNYAVANKLAVATDGTFYVASYGSSSKAMLFKFQLNPVEEPDSAVKVFTESFEADPAGWTLVDADGDGSNWSWTTAASPAANDGSGHMTSASYENNTARTPDNWAISPAIDLSAASGSAFFSVYAKSYSNNYPDTLGFFAGTSADPDEMTQLGADVVPAADYAKYTLDISEFAGESEVYVAVRHYNCTDKWRVYFDTVEVGYEDTATEVIPTAEEIAVDALGVMGAYNYNNGGALAWDSNEDVLYLAANYNKTNDTDHYLWMLDTETGKATKVSSSGNSLFRFCLNGLFIIPGKTAEIPEAEEATDIEVEPTALNLLRGQSGVLSATVYPWTLEEKSVTFESDDETVATVDEDGVVTGVGTGATTVTVTTVAAPNLTATVAVTVEEAPVAELRGIIWNPEGKGVTSVFSTDKTAEWEEIAEVGSLTWGALVDDVIYGSTEDTMYAVDADTYEVTQLGGIVSMWIPSDATALPIDLQEAFAAMGHNVGRVLGPDNNGTYLTMLDPVAGSLIYFDLTTNFGSDPMATFTGTDIRESYTDSDGVTDDNAPVFYMMTESGTLYSAVISHTGYIAYEPIGETGIDLTGVSDVTNQVWASMVYDENNGFLYLAHYDGQADSAVLYAIDPNDPGRNALLGDFGKDVWPVVGLYEYEPSTDLTLKVDPAAIELYEGETAQATIKVKLGETNEYTAESSDESVATIDEDGVITALKEGTATITVTTVDANAEGEKLTATIDVTVKGLTSIESYVTAQVSDADGDHFVSLSLAGLSYDVKAEAPGAVTSGARGGDLYLAGIGTKITALDAEDLTTPASFTYDAATYADYPAQDMANYPSFIDADGEVEDKKVLFTTDLGWLVAPDYYGWNLSSALPTMAGLAFAGTDTNDEGTAIFVYYMITMEGTLYELDIDYAAGKISYGSLLETGIVPAAQSDLSMAFIQDLKYNPVTSSLEPNAVGLVVADNGTQKVWYIDFLNGGEVGLVGTVDSVNISGLVGTYDELTTVIGEMPVDPFEGATELVTFDFEAEPTDWTFVDADEDGYNWTWNHNIASWFNGTPDFDSMAYEGTGCIMSGSYINTAGALEPDNWAVSPAIDLSAVEASDMPVFAFYAEGMDSDYAAENFAIYAGTSADPNEMTKLSDDITATGSWKRYAADLSAFAGESEVYVAIRHYNISDMYILVVDNAGVYTGVDLSAIVEPALENAVPGGYQTFRMVRLGDGFGKLDAEETAMRGTVEQERLGSAANKIVGGLHVASLQNAKRSEEIEEAEENVLAVELFEDEAVTNGLVTLTYDAEKLAVESVTSSLEYKSYHVDAENGIITFAYASADEIAAEETLATVKFSYTYDEDEGFNTTVTVNTLERNDDVAVSEEAVEIVLNIYGQPEWTWTGSDEEGYTAATAKFSDELILDATVTEETTPATCEEAGKTVYTASVELEGQTYTDTKEVEIPALEHDWGIAEDGIVWAEDYSSVTVTLVCANDPTHTMTGSTDEITVTYDPEPGCTEGGYAEYDATFEIEGVPVTVGTGVFLPANGHSFGEPTWSWSDDRTQAAATFACENCDEELVLLAESITSEITDEPGCETEGLETFTATVTFEEETYTDTATLPVAATGHTAGETVIENETPATCVEDGQHDEVVYCTTCDAEISRTTVTDPATGIHTPGEAVTENETPATCTEAGWHDEVVYCTVCNAEISRETVTDEPATGHTPGEAVIENEVAATCEAAGSYDEVVYCTVCNAEISRETVTVEALGHDWMDWVVMKVATCTEDGTEMRFCKHDMNHNETRPITATGHTAAEAVKENEVAATCETAGSYDEVVYCAVCGAEISREAKTIEALGHDWQPERTETGAIKASFNEDYTAATCLMTCANDPTHTMTVETTDIEIVRAIDPACEKAGMDMALATFDFDPENPAPHFIDVPALGHDYQVTYTWSADNATVTAEATCSRDRNHFFTETVETEAVTTAADCENAGQTVYTATFENELFEAQTKTVEIAATGHAWGEWTVTTPAACEAEGVETRTCANDASHVETRAIEATGHAWGEPTFTWSEDNSTLTATIVCANDETHVETAVSESTSETVDPTYSEEGKITYTATVELGGKTYTETKEVVLDKLPVPVVIIPTDPTPTEPTPTEPEKGLPFIDVKEDDWFYEEIKDAYEKGLIEGTSETTYEPLKDVSRAEAVVILWRIEGQPVVNYAMTFEDVAADTWYTEAVRWAASEGIVLGYSETEYKPEKNVSRQELAAILYRYAQTKDKGFKGLWAFQLDFADADQVLDYAYEPMCWCVMNEIFKGNDENKLNPYGTTNRAEAAVVLNRLDDTLKAE